MGFQLVVNYAEPDGNVADAVAYADDAARADMRVVWNLANVWEGAGSAPDNARKLALLLAVLHSLPATWGYYIGDEVAPVDVELVRAAAEAIRSFDPAHPLLQVSCGMCTLGTPAQLLTPFAGVANYLGEDIYPEVSHTQTPSSLEAEVAERAKESLKATQASHTRPVTVLQAWNWSDDTSLGFPPTQFPTVAQMVAMGRGALAEHPALMLWFSFFGLDGYPSSQPNSSWIADPTSTPGRRVAAMTDVLAQLRKWSSRQRACSRSRRFRLLRGQRKRHPRACHVT